MKLLSFLWTLMFCSRILNLTCQNTIVYCIIQKTSKIKGFPVDAIEIKKKRTVEIATEQPNKIREYS